MKLRIFLSAILSLLAMSPSLMAELSAKDYADKFYQEWSAPRDRTDDGAGFMFAHFNREVPVALQNDVLTQMLDRACSAQPKAYGTIAFVFKYIKNVHPEFVMSESVEKNVYALATDSNYLTRRDVLNFLGPMKREKDHDLIIAALNDPKDDVRGAAIDALRDRPEGEATFQKFIQDHQNDPAYHTSVMYAKSGLDAAHENGHSQ